MLILLPCKGYKKPCKIETQRKHGKRDIVRTNFQKFRSWEQNWSVLIASFSTFMKRRLRIVCRCLVLFCSHFTFSVETSYFVQDKIFRDRWCCLAILQQSLQDQTKSSCVRVCLLNIASHACKRYHCKHCSLIWKQMTQCRGRCLLSSEHRNKNPYCKNRRAHICWANTNVKWVSLLLKLWMVYSTELILRSLNSTTLHVFHNFL